MHAQTLLPALAVILVGAHWSGRLSARLGLPPVFGQLRFGLLIGPAGLGGLRADEPVRAAALLGVLVLMFLAGLETDPTTLRQVGRGALGAAIGGMMAPFLGALLLGTLAHMPWPQTLFLGAALTATSVSLSAQTLEERGALRSRAGATILGAAVLEDLLGMAVLALVTGVTGLGQPLPMLGKMALFLGMTLGPGRWLLPSLARRLAQHAPDEGRLALILALVLGMSWAAAVWGGGATITGAYLTGLLLARSGLRTQILPGARFVGYGLLIPVFFVAIGLEAQAPAWTALSPFTLALLGLAVASKGIGGGLGARRNGRTAEEALQVGAGMISRGAVALVIATLGRQAGRVDPLLLVILATTLLPPLLLRLTFTGPRPIPLGPAREEGFLPSLPGR